ncbi:MAG: hypothetical protein AB8C84_02415 [Oligoflexales bacterium]
MVASLLFCSLLNTICASQVPFKLGGSLTDSAISVGSDLSDRELRAALQPLDVIRLSVGPSDFSPYYYDFETDHSFDVEEKIPFLKRVLALRSNLTFMATPWSAPKRFVEPAQSHYKHELKREMTHEYAKVLYDFISFYKRSGIVIHYLSMQNEPLHFSEDYPTMLLPAGKAVALIEAYTKLDSETRILAYDHNPVSKGIRYCLEVADSKVGSLVYGYAFHHYEGDPEAIRALSDRGLRVFHTEISSSRDSEGSYDWHQAKIQAFKKNGAQWYTYWNLFLDRDSGPIIGTWDQGRPLLWVEDGKAYTTHEWCLFKDQAGWGDESCEKEQVLKGIGEYEDSQDEISRAIYAANPSLVVFVFCIVTVQSI